MNEQRSRNIFTFAALAVFALIAAVLGLKTLVDVDIGWHVASGIWMLRHGTVPLEDPFAAPRSEFVAYSWLPELLMAEVFQIFGFRGLQVLQALLVILSVPAIWAACGPASRAPLLSKPLACAAGIALISPTWHLRPQLLSVILFLLFIACGERRTLTFLRAAALTVLWANIHIYWVLGPYVYLAYVVLPALNRRRTAMRHLCEFLALCAAGLVTPYFWRSYKVIWLYMFEHEEAKALIREFQPLGLQHGYVLFVYLLILILACIFRKRTVTRPQSLVLAVPLAFQSALQIKFLPLFGASVLPLLTSELLPPLLRKLSLGEPKEGKNTARAAAAAIGLFAAVCVSTFECPPALPAETQELFQLVRSLKGNNGDVRLLNHFDDGGWIALAATAAGSGIRTAIDGRTLVMGGKRLAEFDRLRRNQNFCAILQSWGPFDAALLKKRFALSAELERCDPRWRGIKHTQHWTLFYYARS